MAKDVNVRIGAKEEVSQASGKAVKAIRDLEGHSNKIGKSLMATWSQATIIIAGVVKAWQAVNRVMQTGTEEYATRLRAEQRLTNAVTATGTALGLTTEALFAHADALSRVTQFGDEAIDSALSILTTFGKISSETMPRATEATLDLAAALGMDLDSAAQKVGLALADPERASRALRQMNVILTRSQEDVIKSFVQSGDQASAMSVILDQLEQQFGGFGEAVGRSSVGVKERFQNLKGDILEQVGQITTALQVNFLNSIQPFLEDFLAWITDNAPAIYAWLSNIPTIAKIAFQTVAQILRRTFEWDTLKNVVGALVEGLVGSFKIGVGLMLDLWRNLIDTLLIAAEKMGNDWWKYLINGFTKNVTSGGPLGRLLLKHVLGVDWEGLEIFDVTGDIGQVMADSFRETSGDFLGSLRTALAEHGNNLKTTFSAIADNYSDITTNAADQIARVIDEGKAKFAEFKAREVSPGQLGSPPEDDDEDKPPAVPFDANAIAAAMQAALDQAVTLSQIAEYGSEYVQLQEQMIEISSAIQTLTSYGMEQQAEILKAQFVEIFGKFQDILADPDGEKRRRQEALQQSLQLAEIARYGEEYVSLQTERESLLASMEVLIQEGFQNQADALRERLGDINAAIDAILNPSEPAAAPEEVVTLMGSLGGLEGIVTMVASGLGGFAEQITTAVLAFGWMGLAVVAVQQIIQGLTSVIGPLINRILEPLFNFLGAIGAILGSVLVPVFNALSPILMMLVQIFSSLLPLLAVLQVWLLPFQIALQILSPMLTALAVAIEVLTSPIRFLGDLFSWVAEKIRYSVVTFAAWLRHPLSEERRAAYIAAQGVTDPGRFTSDAFSGLGARIREILELSGAAPTSADVASVSDLLAGYTGLTEWGGPGAVPGGSGVYGGSVTVTEPPDIYIHIHIGEGGVTVMGDRELKEIGDVVIRAVEEVLNTGGRVSWLPAGV